MTHVPHTCFACRSTFKRPFEEGLIYRKCPGCGGQARRMDKLFRPPTKADDKQWALLNFLAGHGFVFQKIWLKQRNTSCGVSYPSTIEQAMEFVVQFKDQAIGN